MTTLVRCFGMATVTVLALVVRTQAYAEDPPDAARDRNSPSWWLGRALESAEQIEASGAQYRAYQMILAYQVQAEDEQGAEKTRDRLKGLMAVENGCEFQLRLAELFIQSRQPQAASDALRRAQQFPPIVRDKIPRGGVPERIIAGLIGEVAEIEAEAGDFAAAKRTAIAIKVPFYRRRAITRVAGLQAAHDIDAAWETLKASPGADGVPTLTIIEAASQSGRWDLVEEAIRLALIEAGQLPLREQGMAYGSIAGALSRTDLENVDPELIEDVLGAVTRFIRRPKPPVALTKDYADAILEAARGLMAIRRYDEAREAIAKLSGGYASTANAQLAEKLATEGQYAEAYGAAERATDFHKPFRKVAIAQAERGDFEEAMRTARRTHNREAENWAYRRIGQIQAQRGMFNEAKETIRHIRPTDHPERVLATAAESQYDVLRLIAYKQIQAGHQKDARETLDAALHVARSSGEKDRLRGRTTTVARYFAEAGDLELAKALLEQVGASDELIHLAVERQHAGRNTEAEDLRRQAERIAGSGGELPSLAASAFKLHAGRLDEAEQAIDRLFAEAQSEPSPTRKLPLYSLVGGFYLYTDQLAKLEKLALRADDPANRAFAFLGAAAAVVEPEQWTRPWWPGEPAPARAEDRQRR